MFGSSVEEVLSQVGANNDYSVIKHLAPAPSQPVTPGLILNKVWEDAIIIK